MNKNIITQRFKQMAEQANIHKNDIERKQLFYILASNNDLYLKRNHIYDFAENCIKPKCLESDNVDFCSSSKALIRLAYNLYNSFCDLYTTPIDILGELGTENIETAITAVNIRFRDYEPFGVVKSDSSYK